MLRLYNTLTRKKEFFKPIKKNFVGLYTCGPTVYDHAHIGNLRTYIFEDVLKRVLLYNKFKVKHVMNITDVGHLTSDADAGEDKMEIGARREKKTAFEIAEFYTKEFKRDAKRLNILEPNIWCKATDHVKDMIEWIKKLEKKGFTYKTEDGIYFNTSKFKGYGKLAKLKTEGLKAGARIDIKDKKNITDFSLWKFSPKDKKRQMEWESPWGKGFPGWHIECSVMSIKYLGEHFDIHCGGIDHIPVHHTNEIAQSEAVTGKKWVNYWLHGEFLRISKGKMAKSGENFITLQTLIDKGFDPLDYRYMCLNAHYRSPLSFSFEDLKSAKKGFSKLKERFLEIKKNNKKILNSKLVKKYKNKFLQYINDDLDMPKAMALIWEVVKSKKIGGKERYGLLLDFDKVLGLNLNKVKEIGLSEDIKKLIKEREKARKLKDYKKADEIREELRKKGIILEDTKQGVRWKIT
jgi:cysteinyl-tRNA synthetase